MIIFNLKESGSGNSEEKTQHDKAVCSDIFENVIRINNFEIMEVARLGKEPDNSTRPKQRYGEENRPQHRPSNPRPLLVKLKEAKINILKHAKNLKKNTTEEDYKVISMDMFPVLGKGYTCIVPLTNESVVHILHPTNC